MTQLSRRHFLRGAVASAMLIPLVNLQIPKAFAAARVNPDDPTAKALGYVEDATKANRTDKAGVAAAEQHCSNCMFYSGTGEYGGCALFQGGEVAGAGWCTAWQAKS